MDGVVSFYVADGELLETTGETGDAAAGAWKRVRTEDGRNGWVYARLCESNDD
jgi:SH3-like domain-containing protein